MNRFGRYAHPDGRTFFAERAGEVASVLDGAPWLGGRHTGESALVADLTALCPVDPTKILCVGRNYAAHARELGNEVPAEPLLFFKPPSALVGPGGRVVLPSLSQRIEHEAELAVVIGRRARNVAAERAMHHVFGYTCALDVTARDLQKKDGQWTRAKGFDTFCPVGPEIVTEVEPSSLRVLCRVNGALRQDGATSLMTFDVAALVAYASSVMTLEPGDLLLTGTPEGVGPLADGDVLEAEIVGAAPGAPGVGLLRVTVAGPGQ